MDPSELLYGSDRLIEANHLFGQGAVHERRHEFTEAQQLYEEALAMYEDIFGINHLTTALATRNLARVLKAQGKDAEAALMEDHADDIIARRGQDADLDSTPFGGSSGFFSLLGMDRSAEFQPDGDDVEPPSSTASS